jgi:hypothetical protein
MISFEEFAEARDEWEGMIMFGHDGYFTNERVDRESIPEGWFAYDIRSGEDGEFSTLEENVATNHAGTFLTRDYIELPDGYLEIGDDYYRFGGKAQEEIVE